MEITLDHLRPGMGATVVQIGTKEVLRRRLQDFGFVPGTLVRCCYRSPNADVFAIGFRGSILALRRHDLAWITGRL